MALCFVDGLDSGLSKFLNKYGTVNWDPTGGIYGGGAMAIAAGGNSTSGCYILLNDFYGTSIASNPTTHISFWFRTSVPVTNESFFLFLESSAVAGWFAQFSLWNGDGKITPFNYDNDGSIGIAVRPINYNRLDDTKWHHIEIAVKYSPGAGYYRFALDGDVLGTYTNINNTESASPAVIDTISFRNFRDGTIYYDDILVWNEYANNGDGFFSNRIGQNRIYTLRPEADTIQANSTPSSGSDRYSMINEPSLNTSNSVTIATGGRDLYEMSNIANISGTILGATATLYFNAAQPGYAANVRPVVFSNNISYTSNTITSVTTTPKISTIVFNRDFGNSNVQWTLESMNNIQIGFEVLN